MRLIDADAVKDYILREGFYCDTKADREDTAEEIDEIFPTVEAIPIDYLQHLLTTGDFRDYNFSTGIKKAIEMWREEKGD